ncbi:MAG: gentisate 1,2-dioxygenase [Gammaproteobacteria bacterium]|nr:gentisate 1,2-dioxygenase [Gammaproteobacteria bacterium]
MSSSTSNVPGQREDFYARIDAYNAAPLWEVLDDLVPAQPRGRCIAALWRYAQLRPFLLESGALISAREAQRRVLVLENPGCRGEARITSSLYAGLQLLLPGEVAPSHRHSQSALRFVLEGSGAFTAVDGERATMHPGDMILTPSWTWHDHGSEVDEPVIWLDGLDIPLVQFLDCGFCEQLGEDAQSLTRPEGDAYARYGSNLLPVNYQARGLHSPVFSYPYARSREVLETLSRTDAIDPHHGVCVKYINPTTGASVLPTISCDIRLLPGGLHTRSYRATDARVFAVVEGHGRTRIGEQSFEWGPRDIFVVPSWVPHRHEADSDAVLFSYSDKVVQEKLGLWREHCGTD